MLESFVTETRDKVSALKLIKKAMKRHGHTHQIVTDGLRSYGAALKPLNAKSRQAPVRRWKNNRAENSHLPFRRRERAMTRFRRMKRCCQVKRTAVREPVIDALHGPPTEVRQPLPLVRLLA